MCCDLEQRFIVNSYEKCLSISGYLEVQNPNDVYHVCSYEIQIIDKSEIESKIFWSVTLSAAKKYYYEYGICCLAVFDQFDLNTSISHTFSIINTLSIVLKKRNYVFCRGRIATGFELPPSLIKGWCMLSIYAFISSCI